MKRRSQKWFGFFYCEKISFYVLVVNLSVLHSELMKFEICMKNMHLEKNGIRGKNY
jgi:hypothetical protein